MSDSDSGWADFGRVISVIAAIAALVSLLAVSTCAYRRGEALRDCPDCETGRVDCPTCHGHSEIPLDEAKP